MINKYGIEQNELKIPEKPDNNIYTKYTKINNKLLKLEVNKKIIKEKIIDIAHNINLLLEYIRDEE